MNDEQPVLRTNMINATCKENFSYRAVVYFNLVYSSDNIQVKKRLIFTTKISIRK
jgi:hypothetical protein